MNIKRKILSVLTSAAIIAACAPSFSIAASAASGTTTVSSYEQLLSAINSAKAGTVINISSSFKCSGRIDLNKSKSGITIKGTNTQVLDFSPISSATGDKGVGIYITGSNVTITGLIIEHAGDNGIKIYGANNNVVNCITRYNGDSGIQISKATASNNTIRNCYSYRNFDKQTNGGNADGFACKLEAGTGNKFIDCYSWENSDDGWDSFNMNNDVTYINCATWHNGDKTLFGNPSSWDGNGNGFKLGSKGSTGMRYMTNCIAFDNKYISGSKGFDENNNIGGGTITNGIAFNNNNDFAVPHATLKNCFASSKVSSAWKNEIMQKCAGIVATCNSNRVPDAPRFSFFYY